MFAKVFAYFPEQNILKVDNSLEPAAVCIVFSNILLFMFCLS